ncbi:ATP synthase F1 subunit gamma [Candidatus Peregrinibacteria bacterium]|nr:ATP synthase F1 subunit gamma [Candidatus Peregrinibacteria bacterium]
MASLLEIKKKINSVKSTKKITKAMQLVATSKMKNFQKKAFSTRQYLWDLLNVLQKNLSKDMQSIYTEKRTEGKTLFVVYTSDKGLCGALNANILKGAFRSSKWKDLKDDQKTLITIGKKAKEFARSRNFPIEKSFTEVQENLRPIDTLHIIDHIINLWKSKKIKEVIFVAPHFQNTFTFYPVLKTFLPFSAEMIKTNIGHGESKYRSSVSRRKYMYYEPDQDRVVHVLFSQIIQGIFVQSFFELKAAEYSSRMLAMQNATDSADRILGDLTLTYNKARQQAITQQLAELIGASESIAN